MQLAVPRLRSDKDLKKFREELAAADFDLLVWRAARATAADDIVLSQRGEAGWDLAAALLRKQRVTTRGKNAAPGRPSCEEALAHPFLAEDWTEDADA